MAHFQLHSALDWCRDARAENLTLLTDLYQLTMAQSYFREQQLGEATFSLFIRSYPPNRGYFVSAGLCDVLDYLENFAFDPAAIEYLARQKQFSDEFLHYLAESPFHRRSLGDS